MKREYTELFEVIEDKQNIQALIINLSSGTFEIPYIYEQTLDILSDSSAFRTYISNSNKRSLCIMLEQYFNSCYQLFIEDPRLDKILNFGEITIFKVNAMNGLRYATTNEVAQGIRGLIPEKLYPASEEAYKLLCLLHWTFTGRSYYFRKAGYKLTYDKDGQVLNTFYEMILMCAGELKRLFEWVTVDDNYKKAVDKIKKMKRSNGYKYSSYEKDEIKESITIKQLVYNVYQHFPRNSKDLRYRKGLSIAYKSYKNNEVLSPLEISTLRDIYEQYVTEKNNGTVQLDEAAQKLRDKCDLLENERYHGKINQNHFAYKIILTLKGNNYRYCSDKQMAIIEDALKQLGDNNEQVDNSNKTMIISEFDIDKALKGRNKNSENNTIDVDEDDNATQISEISDISDAIGSGLFQL